MRLKRLVDILARRREGIFVLAGVAALLTGVERLMRTPGVSLQRRKHGQALPGDYSAQERRNFFTVRQTRSELGYVFWVLQGHGELSSFELFDSWADAIKAADARLTHFQPIF